MKTSMMIEKVLENRLRSLVGEESIQKLFVKEQCQAAIAHFITNLNYSVAGQKPY